MVHTTQPFFLFLPFQNYYMALLVRAAYGI